ncbi:MAG TPA: helix-turn-helix domain-containing protein [Thermoanaerobaculia bacterium]|nr:helix-turn-helix domain-containing protein [Thermoanaerobaculia bacterium]
MFDPRDLAAAIRKLRGTRHQNALAKSVGVSPGTWCKWEQGGTTPRQVSLVRIAKALGCSVERLREVMEECRRERIGREAPPEAKPPQHPASTPLVQETDRLLRKIDRQLDSLMSSKNALLRMREQLVASQS